MLTCFVIKHYSVFPKLEEEVSSLVGQIQTMPKRFCSTCTDPAPLRDVFENQHAHRTPAEHHNSNHNTRQFCHQTTFEKM